MASSRSVDSIPSLFTLSSVCYKPSKWQSKERMYDPPNLLMNQNKPLNMEQMVPTAPLCLEQAGIHLNMSSNSSRLFA